ncbi:hypothetical protein L195_g031993 [Trifolium pratense]|uniref:Uncharacterized protein n=1 Tax=Trifolium pratense TaxID=57577 RepID=A0A2K3LBY7_TRIPR|nr:hypothetical protein L195_g031993 [Trifolium pratense]
MITRGVMKNLNYARGVGIITRGAVEPKLKTRAFRSHHARRGADSFKHLSSMDSQAMKLKLGGERSNMRS